MNLLSKSDLFAENKLFATLDTTVRKIVVENLPFLLSDTVGFIRKLPTELIESFKSTLDEVREADLLLHVVDVSHSAFEDQIAIVEETLKELLGENNIPTVMVFNKVDAFTFEEKSEDDLTPKTREQITLPELKETWLANQGDHETIFISAKTGEGLPELRQLLYQRVKEIHVTRFPYNDFLYDNYDSLLEPTD